MSDDDFSAWPIEPMPEGKTSSLPRIDRPLKNVESFGDVLRHLREAGLGDDIDEAIRKRGIDPTLPGEEIQRQLRLRKVVPKPS